MNKNDINSVIVAYAVGLCLTAGLFAFIRGLEQNAYAIHFLDMADARHDAMRLRSDDAVQTARGLSAFFSATRPTREQFGVFAQSYLARQPFIQALSYQRLFSSAERAAVEVEARRTFPNFTISERDAPGHTIRAADRPLYKAVYYIEPYRGNEAALGLDTLANPAQVDATRRATDTAAPAMTEPLRLTHGSKEEQWAFLVLAPVYRDGDPKTLELRRRDVVGYAGVVLRSFEFFETLLHEMDAEGMPTMQVDLAAYDVTDANHPILLYPLQPAVARAALPRLLYDAAPPLEWTTNAGGRTWRFVISSQPAFFLSHHYASPLAVIAGLAITLLAGAYVRATRDRTREISLVVAQRTNELSGAKAELEKDIAIRKQVEIALRLRDRALELSANAFTIVDCLTPDYPIVYVNPAFERIIGYSIAEAIGRSCRFLQHDDRNQSGIDALRSAVAQQREGYVVLRNYRKDGTLFWNDIYIAPVKDENGRVTHFVGAQYDVTAAKAYQSQLEHQANHDALTGMPNRNLLRDRLEQALRYAERHGDIVQVAFLDLDNFKVINDSLGHNMGDQLLREVSARVQECLRRTDTVARIGGDEFVLVLPDQPHVLAGTAVVQRVLTRIAEPYRMEGRELYTSGSIGVSVYPQDGDSAETLLQHADIAMYRAKDLGRNNVQFYVKELNDRAQERLLLEGQLRRALEKGELFLHYQPQVDLTSGKIVGVEALIRWEHPELGLLSPVRFIPIAEETGLIVPIGEWTMRTACAQNKAWQDAGLPLLVIAVNVSARQFRDADFVALTRAALDDSGLDPQYLEVELTESMMMQNVEAAIELLRQLKAIGVKIAIDDFGTGYSSLSYLKRFRVDCLKIDKSFIDDVITDPDNSAITRSIISLAHTLRLRVIAEGVETEPQVQYLRKYRCDEMQGYYFSRPKPADEVGSLLREDACLPRANTDDTPTILVVDDDVNILTALKRTLRRDGYRVLTAESAQHGFEVLAMNRVQVILCEQRMPGMSGTEFLSKVKDIYPDSVRIVLSGYTALAAIADAINRGAIYKFLTKPWEDDLLLANVREAFRHYQVSERAPADVH